TGSIFIHRSEAPVALLRMEEGHGRFLCAPTRVGAGPAGGTVAAAAPRGAWGMPRAWPSPGRPPRVGPPTASWQAGVCPDRAGGRGRGPPGSRPPPPPPRPPTGARGGGGAARARGGGVAPPGGGAPREVRLPPPRGGPPGEGPRGAPPRGGGGGGRGGENLPR